MMTTMLIAIRGTILELVVRAKRRIGNKMTRTSHDGSDCTYEVDKPALHANILHGIPVSTTLVIILLKPDVVRWLNC
jgi:hypothetical protein